MGPFKIKIKIMYCRIKNSFSNEGCCYCMLLFGAAFKCIGILYVEYLDLFARGPVLTSLVQITFLVGNTATSK